MLAAMVVNCRRDVDFTLFEQFDSAILVRMDDLEVDAWRTCVEPLRDRRQEQGGPQIVHRDAESLFGLKWIE